MQNIESMPRPEIILVADTVAREKNIDKEDVFTAMEVAIQKAGRSKYRPQDRRYFAGPLP